MPADKDPWPLLEGHFTVVGRPCIAVLFAAALLTGCSTSSGTDADAASSTPPPPCTTSECEAYDEGFARGEEALKSGERIEVPPGFDGTASDDSALGAVQADRRVAEYACGQWVREADYFGAEREAYRTGCLDGSTPMLDGHPNRYKYERGQ
ncbi:hypothetical protein ACIBI4_09335 [Streptomyces sp. NPDC050418]|uniref:hypothetical protein n=1 Tax=Streptomyces sp. NPDC050418 TaxID=3365612 RepID=UPI003792B506